jgi:FkbM family methyltransferase
VDADEEMIRRFRSARPRDVCVCAVVSDTSHEALFTQFDDGTVSSLVPDHIEHWRQHHQIVKQTKVMTRPLGDILRENRVPSRFDLLSIDLEGHDFEAVRSVDLDRYRPRLIVIEMSGVDLQTSQESPICRYLTEHDYGMVSFHKRNGFFLDRRSGTKDAQSGV